MGLVVFGGVCENRGDVIELGYFGGFWGLFYVSFGFFWILVWVLFFWEYLLCSFSWGLESLGR